MSSTTANFERLYSFEEIRNLIAKYGFGADRMNDPEVLGPLFSEEAVWRCHGFGEFHGRSGIQAGLRGIAEKKILWSFHAMATPFIQISEDNRVAEAKWALWELSTINESSGNHDSIMAGVYEAALSRINKTWLIDRLDLTIFLQSQYPNRFNFN
ncbi:nuclear transport factor 2 family protein [Marinobacter zhejiangensis]|uniref:SnoaL-like domain-containing protein n=1 Tax=Marinobacter zhejiangensis TaxID=488535 RepID=A0A1I4PH62_9GAMM|nr:nuclear transport factor 2 family protein [Marinobacter zhejiangensis]SFM26960.1 SnoaL-like domain-containing protein [Marinobacter zhejiangensis]